MTKVKSNEIKVAFKKLALDPKNVRKKFDQNGIRSLAANIAVNGMLQNLIIRPGPKRGLYLVTGGGQRFRAVEHLSQGRCVDRRLQAFLSGQNRGRSNRPKKTLNSPIGCILLFFQP